MSTVGRKMIKISSLLEEGHGSNNQLMSIRLDEQAVPHNYFGDILLSWCSRAGNNLLLGGEKLLCTPINGQEARFLEIFRTKYSFFNVFFYFKTGNQVKTSLPFWPSVSEFFFFGKKKTDERCKNQQFRTRSYRFRLLSSLMH